MIRLAGLVPTAHLLRSAAILCILGVGLATPASAQDRSIRFGATAGLSLATVQAPAGADTGIRQTLAGGAVAQVDVIGPLAVQGQLLLAQRGAIVRGNEGGIRYGAVYLDLPLLARIEGPSLGPVTPYGLAGGFGGLKLFEVHRAGGRGIGLPLEANTSFFRRTDAGVTGGIGGVIDLGRGRRLNLALRYTHGLVDVARSIEVEEEPFTEAPFPSPAETRTVSLMLRLGL